jgi:hypothetical protein
MATEECDRTKADPPSDGLGFTVTVTLCGE